MRSTLIFLFMSLLGIGCKTGEQSKPTGYYENFSEEKFREFWHKQTMSAEYEPTKAVIVSESLLTEFQKIQMAKEIIKTGAEVWVLSSDESFAESLSSLNFTAEEIGKIKVIKSETNSIWVRDYAPLFALTNADGALTEIDTNYYSRRPNDNFVPTEISQQQNINRISIPVYNEGGNIMCTDKICMMSERVVEANSADQVEDPSQILNAEQIADYYEKATNKKDRIVPRIPYEGTGHIDMWAKFVSPTKVIVNEILDETIKRANAEKTRTAVREMQKFLDFWAEDFKKNGFEVFRIPMPLSIIPGRIVTDIGRTVNRGYGNFRSYTNGLILNGTYLAPRYVTLYPNSVRYLDDDLLKSYEEKVEAQFKAAGVDKFVWLDSDDTIAIGGAIHCTTMQVPAEKH